MPIPYAPNNFHTVNIEKFAAEVKQATGGKLAITVYANASLFKMPEIKRGADQSSADRRSSDGHPVQLKPALRHRRPALFRHQL